MYRKKMKRFLAVFLLFWLCVSESKITNLFADDIINSRAYWAEMTEIWECIEAPEPLLSINNNGVEVEFFYDDDNNRIKKSCLGKVVDYTYENGKLTAETRDDGNIQYLYRVVDGEEICYGFIYNEANYEYLFDDFGNVEYIVDGNHQYICKYVYGALMIPQVYQYVDESFIINTDDTFIGNINPIRYSGWYYDRENMCYHIGAGVYYDTINNVYVQNSYTVNEEKLSRLKMARLSTAADVDEVLSCYLELMASSTYGTTVFTDDCVSKTQWNQGVRWYDGLDETELVARCIFAENNGKDRTNDRKAIATVIVNRVNCGMDSSVYGAVTRKSQFSTVNPGSYETYLTDTAIARKLTYKVDSDGSQMAWANATFLAVCICHTTDLEILGKLYIMPDYIDTQVNFLGLNYVYNNNVFSIKNGQWYYGTKAIKDVAIAGEALLEASGTSSSALSPYYKKGYNIFFNYK